MTDARRPSSTGTKRRKAPPTASRTERERMLAGEAYNSRDPELLDIAHRARGLLAAYNATPSTDAVQRQAILVMLLREVGAGVWIEPPFFCDYGTQVRIGANSFVNTNCVFLDSAWITIGANVLLGPGVQLLTATHPLRAADRMVPEWTSESRQAPYRTSAQPITIGDNCWIGAGTLVMPGATIGANTTIGAGSIVTHDIPADVLALGQPCRVIRAL